jgi:hypothetical protein
MAAHGTNRVMLGLGSVLAAVGVVATLYAFLFVLPARDGDGGVSTMAQSWRTVQMVLALLVPLSAVMVVAIALRRPSLSKTSAALIASVPVLALVAWVAVLVLADTSAT